MKPDIRIVHITEQRIWFVLNGWMSYFGKHCGLWPNWQRRREVLVEMKSLFDVHPDRGNYCPDRDYYPLYQLEFAARRLFEDIVRFKRSERFQHRMWLASDPGMVRCRLHWAFQLRASRMYPRSPAPHVYERLKAISRAKPLS